MSVVGRNITSFAGNVKGVASRASVPPVYQGRSFLLLAVKNEKSGRRKGGGAFEKVVDAGTVK